MNADCLIITNRILTLIIFLHFRDKLNKLIEYMVSNEISSHLKVTDVHVKKMNITKRAFLLKKKMNLPVHYLNFVRYNPSEVN